jgi:hypothetical protein
MITTSVLLMLLANVPGPPGRVTKTLRWSCEASRAKIVEYFRGRQVTFPMSIPGPFQKPCPNCMYLTFEGKLGALDSSGRPFGSTFGALRRYTRRQRLQPRVYAGFRADGALTLEDASDGCLASLSFIFDAEVFPWVPIMDGRVELFESNGRLEREYLEAIASQ